MPKVWLVLNLDTNEVDVHTDERPDGSPVDMNAGLLRQVRAAEKRHNQFQVRLNQWYIEVINGTRGRISDGN